MKSFITQLKSYASLTGISAGKVEKHPQNLEKSAIFFIYSSRNYYWRGHITSDQKNRLLFWCFTKTKVQVNHKKHLKMS